MQRKNWYYLEQKVVILMKFSSLTALKVILITFNVLSDENFVKLTFLFRCSVLCLCRLTAQMKTQIDGLVQDYSISIVNALEILLSCTKPSKSSCCSWWSHILVQQGFRTIAQIHVLSLHTYVFLLCEMYQWMNEWKKYVTIEIMPINGISRRVFSEVQPDIPVFYIHA